MKRILFLIVGVCALGGTVFTTGCGPGLIAAGGGSIGAIFGLQGDDDKKSGGSGSTQPSTNVAPAVVVTSLVRGDSPAAINYTILDANNDPCSVEVQYSLNGAPFSACFAGAGGDGTSALASSASGVAHVFSWDFAADLGPALNLPITIRIRANDTLTTGAWAQLTNQVIGNDPPAVSNIAATGTDIILFTFDLGDQSSDLATLEVAFSTDQGQSFTPINTTPGTGYELLGNPPTNLLTSPGGSPGQFVWQAPLSLPDFQGEILVSFLPKDHPAGYADETRGAPVIEGPFQVDTSINNAPVLELLTATDGLTFVGSVALDITLRDDESNPAVVGVHYSIGGSTPAPATLVNQFAGGVAGPFLISPSPSSHRVVWDALADLGSSATFTDVVLILQPADATAGDLHLTDAFIVVGNIAPEVTAIQVLQDGGNVPVVITIVDGESDPVSLLIEYSTDGVNYTTLGPTHFIFGNPANVVSSPFGEPNVLIWDTNIALPNVNQASVTLRVTPTDHPPSSAAADLTGSAFTSAPFPIINDLSGNTPISIDIFTTTSGGAAHTNNLVTVLPSGQVYLDNEINPSSVIGFTTFWKILETGQNFGTLLDVSGSSLQYSTGSISVFAPGGGGVQDGDLLVLDDGLNGPQTIEFDNNALIQIGHVPVFFGGATTASEMGLILAAGINSAPNLRLDAFHLGGGTISLTHQIACKLGDSVSNGGNATNISFTGTAGVVGAQMNGGDGTKRVLYQAPASLPPGTQFVTLVCEIDDPALFTSVFKPHTLWWGAAPTGVTVSPATQSLLVNATQQFGAIVAPAGGPPTGAPQRVFWDVLGGNVNGTIDQNGLYRAPVSVPLTNPVTVRAFCVDGSVPAGTAAVTIQPEPTSVSVTPPNNNPPNWVAPDLVLGAAITFASQVQPFPATPQGVNWRVIWNAQDWGSGNATVGTVNAAGTYTAPQNLPTPDQVRIDAVSQAKPTVFGSYTVRLVAPVPTSFALNPSTASVFAGGAGQQFNTQSWNPPNANTSVTWEMSPAPGPTTGSISQSGFYTPPATSSTVQIITITARSTVAPTVTANATITLNPSVIVSPSSVDISPNGGTTISASQTSQPIQFSALVNPPTAGQGVNWTFVGTPFGNLSSTGLYTPAATNIDRMVRIRATAQASPFPSDEVDVCITGDGQSWTEISNFTLGRGEVSPVWDPVNDRLWYVGGLSETALTIHEDTPIYLDLSGSPAVGVYEKIGGLNPFTKSANAIMCVCDEDNDRLLAIVCQGSGDPVEIYSLNLNLINPPPVPPEPWRRVNAGLQAVNAPKLGGLQRYHCWWDPADKQIQIMEGKSTIYRFDTRQFSATPDSWLVPSAMLSQGIAPVDPLIVSHSWDPGAGLHYFIGATDSSAGAPNRVWVVSRSDFKWTFGTSSGNPPSKGIVNAASYYHNGTIHLFGGRDSDKAEYNDELYTITVGGTFDWDVVSNSAERPLPRGDAGFALAGFNGAYIFGGELPAVGTFGDLWFYNETTNVFSPANPANFRPQGRRHPAGAWMAGQGVVYGGLCDHGVDNGTWKFTYNTGTNQPTWTRVAAVGSRPDPLWGAAGVWVPSLSRFIMHGGQESAAGNGGMSAAYYSFNPSTNTWTDHGTGPPARREAAMCLDTTNNRVWVFGGIGSSGAKLNDLWYLSLGSGLPGTWTQATASGGTAPDPRNGAVIGHDSRSNQILVCGGHNSLSGPNSQLFGYSVSGGGWTPISIGNTGNQEFVTGAAGIYDDECSRIVSTPPAVKKAQAIVMATNGAIWQYLAAPPAANNSTGALGLYDTATGRYYAVFGERTILSRPIGCNNLRTFVFK